MADRPGVEGLVEALDLPRQARRGFGAGLALTVAVFLLFVVAPGGTRGGVLPYLGLGFVLAVSTGLLATVLLVLVRVRRLV